MQVCYRVLVPRSLVSWHTLFIITTTACCRCPGSLRFLVSQPDLNPPAPTSSPMTTWYDWFQFQSAAWTWTALTCTHGSKGGAACVWLCVLSCAFMCPLGRLKLSWVQGHEQHCFLQIVTVCVTNISMWLTKTTKGDFADDLKLSPVVQGQRPVSVWQLPVCHLGACVRFTPILLKWPCGVPLNGPSGGAQEEEKPLCYG